METGDRASEGERPRGGARAYRTPSEPGDDAKAQQGERGMSSVAMRARRGKQGSEPSEKGKRDAKQKPDRPEQAAEGEGEQPMRKGVYLSALIWVAGEWPAARDFVGPAKAAVREALYEAFEEERDGLTLRLKGLEVRNDVEEDEEGAGEGDVKSEATGKREEEKFEF
jgi:hypothetical protein